MLATIAPYVLIISVTALAAVFAWAVDHAEKQDSRRPEQGGTSSDALQHGDEDQENTQRTGAEGGRTRS